MEVNHKCRGDATIKHLDCGYKNCSIASVCISLSPTFPLGICNIELRQKIVRKMKQNGTKMNEDRKFKFKALFEVDCKVPFKVLMKFLHKLKSF
jgi:hypothetical protein